MTNQSAGDAPLQKVPSRIFLDSSTLQTLQDYGEYIYDGGEILASNKIWSIPDGINNLEALQQIMLAGGRGAFELVLSPNSLQEVVQKGDPEYLQWAWEVLDYWHNCLIAYEGVQPPFLGQGSVAANKLRSGKFGYLSKNDAKLIEDAMLLECDVFLTMEQKLPKSSQHIERELGIKVMQPLSFWNLLQPWAALF